MQLTGYQDLKYVDPPRTTIDRPVTAEEAEKPCGYDGPMQTIQLCFSWVIIARLKSCTHSGSALFMELPPRFI